MPDRVEREIEDILNKLDDFVPEKGQQPVPFRKRRKPNPVSRTQGWFGSRLAHLSLNQVMLYALIAVLAAFFFRSLPFASWIMIGSIIVLAVAFIMSMRQGSGGGSKTLGPTTKRWRGQPIDLTPAREPGIVDKIKGWFGKNKR